MLKSLKLISTEGFNRDQDITSALVRVAIKIYNEDVVHDDQDALVALINLAVESDDRSLRYELGTAISSSVYHQVQHQPRLLVASSAKTSYIMSVYNNLLTK